MPSQRSPKGSATSSRRTTTAARPRSARPSSSPPSAGTSTTAPSTAANAGGRGSWPTSHQPAWFSAGTSARNGRARPTPRWPARSRSGSWPRDRTAPGSNWNTATSTGTVPVGSRSATASTATRDGRSTWPGTPPCSRAADMAPTIASTVVDRPAAEVFAYATDPTRFHEWQQGVIDGHLDQPGPAQVGTKCLTTRRIGGASRAVTSELTHIDAPRTWGVQGIDGPILATVDVTVEPLTETSSRLTIAVDFDGHGIGKLLVSLIVRRQAEKEMPANVEALKRRVEAPQPQHPA